MSDLIQYLRQKFPNLDKYDYSDEEVSLWYADQTGQDRQQVGELLGVYDPNQGDFSRGVASGIDSSQALAYGAGALIADTFGAENLRDKALRNYQKNMAQVAQRTRPTDTVEGIKGVGDALDFAQYYSGYGLAQGAQALASGGLGSIIGKQVVKQNIKRQFKEKDLTKVSRAIDKISSKKGGTVGGYTGIGVQAQTTGLGSTYGGAVDKVLEEGGSLEDIDKGRAYGFGALAGAAEGIADVATLGLAKFGPAKNLLDQASKSRLRGAAVRGTQAAAVEGVTEGVQTGLEDLGAGYSAEEARFFDPTAVAAGAIGGGQLGVVGGVLTRPQIDKTEQSQTDLNQTKEQAKDDVGEQLGLDLDDPNSVEQYKANQQQQAARAADQQKQAKEQQDAENEVIRLEAKEFPKSEFKKLIDAGIETAIDDRTSELGKKFLEFLNTPTPENPRGIIDDAEIQEARKQFIANEKKEKQLDNVKSPAFNAAYDAELVRRVAEKTRNEGQIEFDLISDEQKKKALGMRVRNRTSATAKAKTLFGENFISDPKYADLAAAINAVNFNVKKFNVELDKIVNPTPPAAETTTTKVQPSVEVSTTTQALENSELRNKLGKKDNQRNKVYDAVLQAVASKENNNLISVVWNSGENNTTRGWETTFNTPELKKATGSKNDKTAKTQVSEFKKAFNETFTGEQVRDILTREGALNTTQFEDSGISESGIISENPEGVSLVNKPNESKVEGAGIKFTVSDKDRKAFKDAGMTTEAINAITQDPQDASRTAEAEQAEIVLENRRNEEFAVENADKLLRAKWVENTAQNGPSYDDLSMENKIDWMHSVYRFLDDGNFDALSADANRLTGITTAERTDDGNQDTQDNQVRRTEVQADDQNQANTQLQEDGKGGTTTDPATAEDNADFTAVKGRQANVETREKKKLVDPNKEGTRSGPRIKGKITLSSKNPNIKFGIDEEFELTEEEAAAEWAKLDSAEFKKAQANARKRKNFERVVKQVTGKKASWRIKMYDSIKDVIAAKLRGEFEGTIPDSSYGFVTPDQFGSPTAHIILDRVKEGQEKAIFLHEVGGHIGIDNIIDKKTRRKIADVIRSWETENDNAVENILARRVRKRINNAVGAIVQKQRDEGVPETKIVDPFSNVEYESSELIAYFLEEATLAGIEPSVKSPLGRLVRQLYAFFKAAIRRANLDPRSLNARDIVDLGWGATRFSLSTRKHGTAANFHRFDSRMVGTGEGNQAYGFGWYLAERFGIARFYLRADERRKREQQKYNYEPPKIPLSSLSPEFEARIRNPPRGGLEMGSPSVLRRDSILTNADEINKAGKPQPYLIYDMVKRDFIVHYPAKSGDFTINKKMNGDKIYLTEFIDMQNPRASKKNFSGLLPSIDADTRLDFDNQFGRLTKQTIKDYRAWETSNKIEGSFMHIDTTVQDEELLPWTEYLSSSPEIKDNLVETFEFLRINQDPRLFDILDEIFTNKQNLYDTTDFRRVKDETLDIINNIVGKRYELRNTRDAKIKKREDKIPSGLELEELVSLQSKIINEENQKIAEEYNEIIFGEGGLTKDVIDDIIGSVTGRKLYDGLYNYQFENNDDTYDVDYLNEYLQGFLTEDQKLTIQQGTGGLRADAVVSMFLDNIGIKGVIYPDAGTLGNFEQGAEGMSNNVVIFNDDNLFIVGRTPGKKVKRKQNVVDEIKFGISEDWIENTHGGEKAKQAWSNAKEIAQKAAESTKFLHQVIKEAKDKVPSLGKWYEAVLRGAARETEIRKGFEAIALRARDLKPERLNLLNDFISRSTFEQKWGYDPEIEGKQVTVDSDMANQFAKLTDDEQQIAKDIFAHGENMKKIKRKIAKEKFGNQTFFTDASLEGPYAPLKRFGSYVTVLKSEAMYQAELAMQAEGSTKEDRELYDKLSQDPSHYVVSFFDTKGAGEVFEKANASKFKYRSTTRKLPDRDADRLSNPEAFEKVLGALNAGTNSALDGQAKQLFSKMVKDLYFKSLDERNARLSGAKRLNRAGYDKNMIRSFISHAKAEARLIAQMENATDINTALINAEQETKTEGNVRDPEKNAAYVLVAKHYNMMLKGDDTPIQDRINAANSVYMLLTSVGYHVTNATQPTMVTVPRVAGDFGDYRGAWNGLTKGYKLATKIISMSSAMETNVNVEKAPAEYQQLLKKMELYQLLDVGMEEDLTSFERFDTGFDALNLASDTAGKITHKLYQVSRLVEATNRVSAAVAAFDMAKKNPQRMREMNMTAEDYAIAVVEDTQGNFSKLDAPQLLKFLPKVVTQYRKYQLLMAWHYANAFKQMFRGETPESRAAGRRILMYSLAHAGAFAGSVGMPMVSTLFWVATFFGDEDEPQDLERWIKTNIDDGLFGQVLSRGILSSIGVDFSTKLDQSKIFAPLPYVDFQTGEAGYKEILGGLVGPAGTTASNFFRAHEYFSKGDLMKGVEYSVPKGVRTALESYRLATEGYTMRNGDVVVDPREISNLSIFLNALGIPSGDVQNIKWTRGQQFVLEQYFSTESGKLRKEYIEANKNRDRATQRKLREEWKELQKAKDRVRPFFNNAPGTLNKQPVMDLIRAPREQRKRERKAQVRFGN